MLTPKVIYNKTFTAKDLKISFIDAEDNLRPEYKQEVEQLWQEFLEEASAKGLSPWNGKYYALANINNQQQVESLNFELAETNFARIKALKPLSEKYGDLKVSEYTYHISTCTVIKTTDGFFAMGERGKTMNNSNVDFIGGGLQPDEIEVKTGEDVEQNARKEMLEEAGIKGEHIKNMQGIGILLSATSNVLIMYYAQLNLNCAELLEVFKTREDKEMQTLIFVPTQEYGNYLSKLTSYRPLVSNLLNLK